jgi:hypothetical protein
MLALQNESQRFLSFSMIYNSLNNIETIWSWKIRYNKASCESACLCLLPLLNHLSSFLIFNSCIHTATSKYYSLFILCKKNIPFKKLFLLQHSIRLVSKFYLFYFCSTGVDTKASWLLSKYSTTWAMPPAILAGVLVLVFYNNWGLNLGLTLARQVLYHLSHFASHVLCWVFTR